MGNKQLMRLPYSTDQDLSDPESIPMFSGIITASARGTIVGVDWVSEPGQVWVTYLLDEVGRG